MRELRIMLPDELWEKLQGHSPQQMKLLIASAICLYFQLTPEPKTPRKTAKQSEPKNQQRDRGGRFSTATVPGAPPRKLETVTASAALPPSTRAALAPQNPPEITVLEPRNPQTMPTNVALEPQTPPKNTVEEPDNRQKATSDMDAGNDKEVKLHPAYNIGF